MPQMALCLHFSIALFSLCSGIVYSCVHFLLLVFFHQLMRSSCELSRQRKKRKEKSHAFSYCLNNSYIVEIRQNEVKQRTTVFSPFFCEARDKV